MIQLALKDNLRPQAEGLCMYMAQLWMKIDQDKEAAQLMQEIQSGTQTTREPVYSREQMHMGSMISEIHI